MARHLADLRPFLRQGAHLAYVVGDQAFPNLVCRPIATQFMDANVIAMFEFEQGEGGISIAAEKHYRLVPPDDMTVEDLKGYRQRLG